MHSKIMGLGVSCKNYSIKSEGMFFSIIARLTLFLLKMVIVFYFLFWDELSVNADKNDYSDFIVFLTMVLVGSDSRVSWHN